MAVTGQTAESFVADFSSHLRGSAVWRRRVVAEMSDGLACAVEDECEKADDRREAERAVVSEWGDAKDLAAEFNEIAAATRACSFASRILFTAPLLALGWATVVLFSPVDPWDHEPIFVHFATRILGISMGLALGCSLMLVRRGRRGPLRWSPPSKLVLLAASGIGVAFVMIFSMLFYRASAAVGAISWPLAAGPALLSILLAVLTFHDVYRVVAAKGPVSRVGWPRLLAD